MARALEGGVPMLVLYLVTVYAMILRLRSARARARRAGDTVASSLTAGAIGAVIAIALSGIFLGVLERPVELVLWAAPAIALSWPVEPTQAGPGRARAVQLAEA